MKFPDVSELGAVTIEGAGRFVVYMIKDDWEPDEADHYHDGQLVGGGCECPYYPPLHAIEEAAQR